jgi:hypothetical protein
VSLKLLLLRFRFRIEDGQMERIADDQQGGGPGSFGEPRAAVDGFESIINFTEEVRGIEESPPTGTPGSSRVACVGECGAGKSTTIKVVDVRESFGEAQARGQIIKAINGEDSEVERMRSEFHIVFQKRTVEEIEPRMKKGEKGGGKALTGGIMMTTLTVGLRR